MKTRRKGLQNLTETQKKIDLLMQKEKLTTADLDNVLDDTEREILSQQMTDKLNNLKGVERDEFIEKIEGITSKSTKNQLWESNHINITRAISSYIEDYGKMPGKNQISEATGLSRQTIHKHIKEYDSHPLFAEEMQKFRFMANRVLSKMFRKAVEGPGDTRAARLYFEVLGYLNSSSKEHIKTQNNYIQINGKIISQEVVQNLATDKIAMLNQIFDLRETAKAIEK